MVSSLLKNIKEITHVKPVETRTFISTLKYITVETVYRVTWSFHREPAEGLVLQQSITATVRRGPSNGFTKLENTKENIHIKPVETRTFISTQKYIAQYITVETVYPVS